ncbi:MULTISPECIES: hypothetical protein [Rufibacter]|uniref:Uncharacterized protein n=1 Tax=Rufibacter quisquiliarum TaxID=1549639 RepID=A0A839GCD7_9BACT|nr:MULTISPECIES: hypothetical protein [Rufibacter]MBA9076010.1 hypothetical protein [Rufibacter quisquiliarum]
MAKKKADNSKKTDKPEKKARVHPELEGFEIKINPLGDISSNFNIDQLNEFLDRNVTDKKLVGDQGKKRVQEEDEEYPIEETVEEEENEEDFFKGSANLADDEDEDDAPKEEDDDLAPKKPKRK